MRRPVATAFAFPLRLGHCRLDVTTGDCAATWTLPLPVFGRRVPPRHHCLHGGQRRRQGRKATVKAKRRRMASAGRGEVRARKGAPWRRPAQGRRGTQIARNAPPATAASRHLAAADATPKRGFGKGDVACFPRQKTAWPRSRRRARPTCEAARLASAASVRHRRIGRAPRPISAKREGFSGKAGGLLVHPTFSLACH